MSLRDRVLIGLGVIGAIGLVVYPLAYRISTEQARAQASKAPTPAHTLALPSIAPTPFGSTTRSTDLLTPFAPTAQPSYESWRAEATAHRGANGKSFDYVCSQDGTFGPIWGTDTYTDDSSVCTAGVHRGVITREGGGTVRIIIRPALARYVGTTRNGVTTEPFGTWDGSYEVVED
jgi:hypothetical protein